MMKHPAKTACLFLIAVAGWFAVLLQFYLLMVNRVTPVPEAVIRFFSFFTILTNILVATYATTVLLPLTASRDRFLTLPATASAITVYISVVGIIYNVVLRSLWHPEGLQQLVDELLHSLIPALFVVYWLLFVPKSALQWGHAPRWLIYPLCYLVFILVRGTSSGFYPYPFIDVSRLGYSRVLVNVFFICCVFLLLSLLAVTIGKIIKKKAAGRLS